MEPLHAAPELDASKVENGAKEGDSVPRGVLIADRRVPERGCRRGRRRSFIIVTTRTVATLRARGRACRMVVFHACSMVVS